MQVECFAEGKRLFTALMHRIELGINAKTAEIARRAWWYIFLYQFCSMEQTTQKSATL